MIFKVKLNRQSLNSGIFYSALVLYIIISTASSSTLIYTSFWNDALLSFFGTAVEVLLLIKTLNDSYELKNVVIGVALVMLMIISVSQAKQNLILFGTLFVVASNHIDLRKAIKVAILAETVTVLLIVFLFLAGVIENNLYQTTSGTIRNSLGFLNANSFGGHVVAIVLGMIFLMYEYFSLKIYLLFLAVSLLVSMTSRTRTAFMLCVIGLLLTWLSRHFKNKVIFIISLFAILLSSFLSVLSIVWINRYPVLLMALDKVVSGRVSSISWYYNRYGFSWLGQETSRLDTNRNMNIALDNAYVTLGIRYGLIILIVFVAGLILLNLYGYKNNNNALIIITALISIWGIFETCNFRFEYNFSILLLSYSLYKMRN